MHEKEKVERAKHSTGVYHTIAGGFATGAIPIEICRSYVYDTGEVWKTGPDEGKAIKIQVGKPGSVGVHIGDGIFFLQYASAKKMFERALQLIEDEVLKDK